MNSAPLTLRKRLDNLGFKGQNNKVSFNYTNAFVPTHNRGLLNAHFSGTMART